MHEGAQGDNLSLLLWTRQRQRKRNTWVKTSRERTSFPNTLPESILPWEKAAGRVAKHEVTSLSPKLSCSGHNSHQIPNRWTGSALGRSIFFPLNYDEWEGSNMFISCCSLIHLKAPDLSFLDIPSLTCSK